MLKSIKDVNSKLDKSVFVCYEKIEDLETIKITQDDKIESIVKFPQKNILIPLFKYVFNHPTVNEITITTFMNTKTNTHVIVDMHLNDKFLGHEEIFNMLFQFELHKQLIKPFIKNKLHILSNFTLKDKKSFYSGKQILNVLFKKENNTNESEVLVLLNDETKKVKTDVVTEEIPLEDIKLSDEILEDLKPKSDKKPKTVKPKKINKTKKKVKK